MLQRRYVTGTAEFPILLYCVFCVQKILTLNISPSCSYYFEKVAEHSLFFLLIICFVCRWFERARMRRSISRGLNFPPSLSLCVLDRVSHVGSPFPLSSPAPPLAVGLSVGCYVRLPASRPCRLAVVVAANSLPVYCATEEVVEI